MLLVGKRLKCHHAVRRAHCQTEMLHMQRVWMWVVKNNLKKMPSTPTWIHYVTTNLEKMLFCASRQIHIKPMLDVICLEAGWFQGIK